jgi:hypothetical protein
MGAESAAFRRKVVDLIQRQIPHRRRATHFRVSQVNTLFENIEYNIRFKRD